MMNAGSEVNTFQSEAQAAYQAGDFRKAADNFRRAADLLNQNGDILAAAEMSNNQSVALMRAGDAPSALKACAGTDALFAQAGDVRRQALALGNQAAALEGAGKWKDAIGKYELSAQLLEKVGEKELLSVTLQSLSAMQLKHNRQIDALVSMQSSLAAKPSLTVKESLLRRLIRLVYQLFQHVPGG